MAASLVLGNVEFWLILTFCEKAFDLITWFLNFFGIVFLVGLGWHEHWNNEEHSLQGIPGRLLQVLSG